MSAPRAAPFATAATELGAVGGRAAWAVAEGAGGGIAGGGAGAEGMAGRREVTLGVARTVSSTCSSHAWQMSAWEGPLPFTKEGSGLGSCQLWPRTV